MTVSVRGPRGRAGLAGRSPRGHPAHGRRGRDHLSLRHGSLGARRSRLRRIAEASPCRRGDARRGRVDPGPRVQRTSTATSASTSTAPTGCRSTCSWAGWTCATTLDLRDRLELSQPTVTAADLALSKLQIVEFTEKDQQDTRTLLEHLEIAERHDAIDPRRIQEVTCSDWGWHRTVSANLERFNGADDVVGERASRLLELMQEWPKSRRWNRRARVGTRKPWYRLPEEVAHGSAVGGA